MYLLACTADGDADIKSAIAEDDDLTLLQHYNGKADGLPSTIRDLGVLQVGAAAQAVPYETPPRFCRYQIPVPKVQVATQFDIWCRSSAGDPMAWLLNDQMQQVAYNDDVDSDNTDAHIRWTVNAHSDQDLHYLLFREAYLHHELIACTIEPRQEPPAKPPIDQAACTNTCKYAHDGVCDDGSPSAQYSVCARGTDCADCSGGSPVDPPVDPPPQSGRILHHRISFLPADREHRLPNRGADLEPYRWDQAVPGPGGESCGRDWMYDQSFYSQWNDNLAGVDEARQPDRARRFREAIDHFQDVIDVVESGWFEWSYRTECL